MNSRQLSEILSDAMQEANVQPIPETIKMQADRLSNTEVSKGFVTYVDNLEAALYYYKNLATASQILEFELRPKTEKTVDTATGAVV